MENEINAFSEGEYDVILTLRSRWRMFSDDRMNISYIVNVYFEKYNKLHELAENCLTNSNTDEGGAQWQLQRKKKILM